MVAMTPFVINFLMRSIGLFSIFWARSRITMLEGNSIFVLIGHLLARLQGFHSTCVFATKPVRACERVAIRSYRLLAGLCLLRQSLHKIFQIGTIFLCQLGFERMLKSAFESTFPTFTSVM